MRIGVNTLPLFPGQIGEMETYTVDLLTHLAAMDSQHTYYPFVARYNRDLLNVQCQRQNVVTVPTLSVQGFWTRLPPFKNLTGTDEYCETVNSRERGEHD